MEMSDQMEDFVNETRRWLPSISRLWSSCRGHTHEENSEPFSKWLTTVLPRYANVIKTIRFQKPYLKLFNSIKQKVLKQMNCQIWQQDKTIADYYSLIIYTHNAPPSNNQAKIDGAEKLWLAQCPEDSNRLGEGVLTQCYPHLHGEHTTTITKSQNKLRNFTLSATDHNLPHSLPPEWQCRHSILNCLRNQYFKSTVFSASNWNPTGCQNLNFHGCYCQWISRLQELRIKKPFPCSKLGWKHKQMSLEVNRIIFQPPSPMYSGSANPTSA